MSTWYDAFWPALKSVIQSAWPEIPAGQLFTDVNIERRDWTNLLDSRQIVGPWVVVTLDVAPTAEWGVGATRYEVTPTIYYITPHTQGVTGVIIGKIESLATALTTLPADLGTVLNHTFAPSFNASNVINRSLLDADQQFQAGSLAFTSVVVVT